MAPALQTSKRKFYKLLDNLNASSTSVNTTDDRSSTTTGGDGPSAKRTRLSMESARTENGRPSSVRVVGSRILATSSKGVITATADPGKSPNYQPYSQARFLERLKTFSDVKIWTYKPTEVSEVEWAKRGWVCEAKRVDTVACKGGCEARVVIRLEGGRERARTLGLSDSTEDNSEEEEVDRSDWSVEPDDQLVQKYKDFIVEGHKDSCLWRIGGCKDDIYRIRMADASVWQTELRERYLALLDIESSLPEVLKYPDTDEVSGAAEQESKPGEAVISSISDMLPSLLTASPPTSAEGTDDQITTAKFNSTAATLAIFGWSGISPHNIHLASCDRCFQRVGLWLYTSNPTNKALPAAASGISDDDIMRFDLKDMHREFCPWVNAQSQAGLGAFQGLAGWEILVSLVRSIVVRRSAAMHSVIDGEAGESESTVGRERSRDEVEKEDRERQSRLAKLKRVFTVKKTDKRENRKSWKNGIS